jgi:hypothetical protein
MNACFPGLAESEIDKFHSNIDVLEKRTYITCLSEYCPPDQRDGRLSMWRAYGGKAGVALIFDSEKLLSPTVPNILTSPVAYLNDDLFGEELTKLINGIEANQQFVKEQPASRVANYFGDALKFAALATKHCGFLEEQEWRIIAAPPVEAHDALEECVESIRGIPQKIQKLKLREISINGSKSRGIADFLHAIVIGRCDFPDIVEDALVKLLNERDLKHPTMIKSAIPLRHF